MAQAQGNNLACEISPSKNDIDQWLNENKQITWIAEQLKQRGEYISTNSISKYKKHREELINQEIEKLPEFQAKKEEVQSRLNDSVAQIKTVDLIGRLSDVIEDSAELLRQAKLDSIKINSVKDLRMVQQTMLDAIGLYGETMLNAQKFQAIQEDPTLVQHKSTTINVNIKDTLTDILKQAAESGTGGYNLIDTLRKGLGR